MGKEFDCLNIYESFVRNIEIHREKNTYYLIHLLYDENGKNVYATKNKIKSMRDIEELIWEDYIREDIKEQEQEIKEFLWGTYED